MAYWWLDACAVPDARAAAALQASWAQRSPVGVADERRAAVLQLAALQRTPRPRLERPWFSVFAADHGIADALGLHAATGAALAAMAAGTDGLRASVREIGGWLAVVNLGVRDDPGELAGVRREVMAATTADFRVHPAMSAEQALRAIAVGAASVAAATEAGAQLYVGTTLGDAGTASARALACRLLGISPQALCGGAADAAASTEFAVLAAGLARHVGAVDALACLRRLGGFEIAALAGACVAAAQAGLPMLVDGITGAVAAMVAAGLNADCRPWLLCARHGDEPGFERVATALRVTPIDGGAEPVSTVVAALRMACSEG